MTEQDLFPKHDAPSGYAFEVPPAQPPRQTRRLSTATVAGLLAGALVVGGAAGTAGAAGYDLLVDRNETSRAADSSPVVSTGASQDAPAGSVQAVAAEVLPSVVKINVSGFSGSGSGSGIVISSDGEILTNNHVASMAGSGGRITVNFNDGSSAPATIVGTDPMTDLAVIKATGVSNLAVATLNDSDALAVGQEVVAIGSPFGLEATVTSGIISALNRPVTVQGSSEGETTYPAIQTDTAINPGNSGGPLVNMNGEVIGINSSIRSTSGGSSAGSIGLGFSIPIKNVLPIVEQLRAGQTPTHARMGVTVADVASEDGLVTGARLQDVGSGSAAEKAGLRSGDVVTKVGDDLVTGTESLIATIRGHRPGDKVTVTALRGSETKTFEVTLDSDGGSAAS